MSASFDGDPAEYDVNDPVEADVVKNPISRDGPDAVDAALDALHS